MQVLPQCGHAVHEDVPDKALTIDIFNRIQLFMEFSVVK